MFLSAKSYTFVNNEGRAWCPKLGRTTICVMQVIELVPDQPHLVQQEQEYFYTMQPNNTTGQYSISVRYFLR